MKPLRSLLALALLAAAPAVATFPADLHPAAFDDGTNALGNTIYCVTSGSTGTTICLNNVDPADAGFNDPTADAAPDGANAGTTIGEKRINAFLEAFRIWSDVLDTNETIWVQGTFQPLACEAEAGVLGGAQTIQIFAGFDDDGGPSWPFTWYNQALANRLADEDLGPDGPDPGFLQPPYGDDIYSIFNSELGTPGCLENSAWYYGYDGDENPAAETDFLAVLTHEMNHGLGFANLVDEGCIGGANAKGCQPPGSLPEGLPDIYTVFSRDWNTQTHWNQMNDALRSASAVGDELVWDGPNVQAAAAAFLGPGIAVRENSPDSETFRAQAAFYAPAPTAAGVTDDVVLFNDGIGPDPNDACDAFDPAVAGKIALIHRGTCNFAFKSLVAELSGAVGVIIVNNQPSGLPPMGGACTDFGLICHIPSVGIAKSAGDVLKADLLLGTVNATILEDATLLAGADRDGFPRLYAPNPVEPGSSVSHWDISLTPNALMEPFINEDLDVAASLDLSPYQLQDIGWDGNLYCPVGSDDTAGNLVIDGCDTGVDNAFGPWTLPGGLAGPKGNGFKTTGGTVNGGCYLADLLNSCERQSANHGDYANCVGATANGLRKLGAISSGESDALKACAEASSLP